jgi:hypothetical protein
MLRVVLFVIVNLLIKMTYYNNGRAEVPRNINNPAYNDMIVIKYRDGYNNTWIYKVIQYDGGR